MTGMEGIPVKLSDEDVNAIANRLFHLLASKKAKEEVDKGKDDVITQAVLCKEELHCSPATFNKWYRIDFPWYPKGSARVYHRSDVKPWQNAHKQVLEKHQVQEEVSMIGFFTLFGLAIGALCLLSFDAGRRHEKWINDEIGGNHK